MWYRATMDAIWKYLIGWDFTKRRATGTPGLYGHPIAGLESTEEQTRKLLHGHCLVWMQNFDKVLKALQDNRRKIP